MARGKRRKGWGPTAKYGRGRPGFWSAPGIQRRRKAARPGKAMTVYYVCPICAGPHSRSDHA